MPEVGSWKQSVASYGVTSKGLPAEKTQATFDHQVADACLAWWAERTERTRTTAEMSWSSDVC